MAGRGTMSPMSRLGRALCAATVVVTVAACSSPDAVTQNAYASSEIVTVGSADPLATSTPPPAGAGIEWTGDHVAVDTFAEAIDAGAQILDVRTPDEFAQGHIPGAHNLDLTAPDFMSQVKELDPAGLYAVYCRSGNRSRTAIEVLRAEGITQTVGLAGGVGAWPGQLVTD